MHMVTCPGIVSLVFSMLLYIEVYVVHRLYVTCHTENTNNPSKRGKQKMLFFLCQGTFLFLLLLFFVCLFLLSVCFFFFSEIKGKIRVRGQREGGKFVCRETGVGKEAVLLYNLCHGCWKLCSLVMRAKARRWGTAGPGGRKRREQRYWGGWGRCRKTKQLQGRGREDGFSLIRREHEGKLKQHTNTHPPSAPHPHPPEKKIHHTDFFMVWQSSDKIIRWGSHSPFPQSLSPSAPRLK